MRTKMRLKKSAALLIAVVVAFTMIPAGMKEVQAAEQCGCTETITSDNMDELCPVCHHTWLMHSDGPCVGTKAGGSGNNGNSGGGGSSSGGSGGSSSSSSVSGGGGSSSGGGGGGGASHSSGSDGEMDRKKSSEPPVPSKTPEQIARERVIAEGEEHQAAIKQESEINKAVQVGGSVVRSTLPGAYTAKSVRGTAVRTPLVQAESDLGLSEGEKLNVTTWDVTVKNSPLAAASLESAANSVGGEAGAMFQVNIDKIVDGKPQTMSLLNGSVTMTVGVPENINTEGGTIAVAHVIAGGAYEVQRDQDNDPNTATFNASAGESAYALVTNPDEELLQKAENNTLADQVAAAIPSLGWRNDGLFIMGGGAAQTAANAGTGTGTGTSEAVASATTQYAINSISATPAGGTANIAIAGSSLDSSIVRNVLARRDINICTGCFVDGKLCTIIIPAGADLSDLIRPDGTIEIKKLAKKFGKTEVQ